MQYVKVNAKVFVMCMFINHFDHYCQAPDVQSLTEEVSGGQQSDAEKPASESRVDRTEQCTSVPPPTGPAPHVSDRSISSTPPVGNPGALQPHQENSPSPQRGTR